MNTAAKVAKHKAEHPEMYCPHKRCLWRTGDGSHCPRHKEKVDAPIFYKEEVEELVEKAREGATSRGFPISPVSQLLTELADALEAGHFDRVPDEPESEEEKKTWTLLPSGNPAYVKGWEAGMWLEKDDYPPNPYPSQTPDHRAWRAGFNEGRANWDMDGGCE